MGYMHMYVYLHSAHDSHLSIALGHVVTYIARKTHLHAFRNTQLHRAAVMEHSTRCDGRQLHAVRPLSAETDVLPVVHGSALFSRGQTQVLSTVTLGPR
jgi:polyribonucleotide nucleotidyltransferase